MNKPDLPFPAPNNGFTAGAAIQSNGHQVIRDTSGDFFIRPGQTLTVDVVKTVEDNRAPILSPLGGPRCASKPFNTSEVRLALHIKVGGKSKEANGFDNKRTLL